MRRRRGSLALLGFVGVCACNALVGLDALDFVDAAASVSSTAASSGGAGMGGQGAAGGGCVPSVEVCGNDVDEDCDRIALGCLIDDGLVARYYIAEADAGLGPGVLEDAAPNPVPLTIVQDGGDPVFVELLGHRALQWGQTDTTGRASVTITGTKLYNALHGSTRSTIEVVADVEAPSTAGTVLVHYANSYFTLWSPQAAFVELHWRGGMVIGKWQLSLTAAGRTVLHAVLDTTLPAADARVTLYQDGALVQATSGVSPPALDETIDLVPTNTFVLGNADDDNRSFRGRLHYAALYSTAFAAADVAVNAAVLGVKDDPP